MAASDPFGMTVDVQLSLRWGDQSYLNQALRLQGGQGLGAGLGLEGGVSVMSEEDTVGYGKGWSEQATPVADIRSFSVTIKHARGCVLNLMSLLLHILRHTSSFTPPIIE